MPQVAPHILAALDALTPRLKGFTCLPMSYFEGADGNFYPLHLLAHKIMDLGTEKLKFSLAVLFEDGDIAGHFSPQFSVQPKAALHQILHNKTAQDFIKQQEEALLDTLAFDDLAFDFSSDLGLNHLNTIIQGVSAHTFNKVHDPYIAITLLAIVSDKVQEPFWVSYKTSAAPRRTLIHVTNADHLIQNHEQILDKLA